MLCVHIYAVCVYLWCRGHAGGSNAPHYHNVCPQRPRGRDPIYVVCIYLFPVYIYGVEDMPAGQTPHTIIVFAHNDLVDAVQPGDRVTVTGIYRALPLRANPRQRNVLSVYKTHIDVVHFRKMDAKRLYEADNSDGSVRKFIL